MESLPDYKASGVRDDDQLKLLEGRVSILVTVGIGNGAVSWTIQKKLLIAHSSFFAASLKHDFIENASNTVLLPEGDPAVFQTFVQYLYTGYFNIAKGEDTSTRLVHCSVLGDNLGCESYRDQTLSRLILMHRCPSRVIFTPGLAELAFTKATADSDLCRWIVMQYTVQSHFDMLGDTVDEWESVAMKAAEFGSKVVRFLAIVGIDDLYSAYDDGQMSDERYLQAWVDYELVQIWQSSGGQSFGLKSCYPGHKPTRTLRDLCTVGKTQDQNNIGCTRKSSSLNAKPQEHMAPRARKDA